MKKQLIIIGIFLLLLTVGLSGCNEKNDTQNEDTMKNKILGIWKNNVTDVILHFYDNNTLKIILDYEPPYNSISWHNYSINPTMIVTNKGTQKLRYNNSYLLVENKVNNDYFLYYNIELFENNKGLCLTELYNMGNGVIMEYPDRSSNGACYVKVNSEYSE